MNNGGDVLARGGRSAQFASAGGDLSEFEYDFKVKREVVKEKYGLSDSEIEEYEIRINAGERFSLDTTAARDEQLGAGITVIDRRPSYIEETETAREAPVATKKWPEKTYAAGSPLLDRVLIKRCADGPDMKLMADGSILNTKTNLVIAAKYRQHSNVGIVLAVGQFVILGGQRIAMSDVVRVGDRVTYGDYNSEIFPMDVEKTKALCDAVQMNYEEDPEGVRVVRVQDIRIVEREAVGTESGLLSEFSGGFNV